MSDTNYDDLEPSAEMQAQLDAMEASDDARVAAFPKRLRETVIQSVRRTDRMAILLWLAHSDARREVAQQRDHIDALQVENERLRREWDAIVDHYSGWDRDALLAARDALQARVTLLEGLLQNIEWGPLMDHGCPFCGRFPSRLVHPVLFGHSRDCQLAVALRPDRRSPQPQ